MKLSDLNKSIERLIARLEDNRPRLNEMFENTVAVLVIVFFIWLATK
jgi:hypothetical protein